MSKDYNFKAGDIPLDTFINMIRDAWYYLMDPYQQMSFIKDEKELCNIVINNYVNGDDVPWDLNSTDKLNLIIELNEEKLATLEVDSRRNFNFEEYKNNFTKLPQVVNNYSTSSLIPDGIMAVSYDSNLMVSNRIMDEILNKLNMNYTEFMSTVFKEVKNEKMDSLLKNMSIKISYNKINEFEITSVMIPMISDNEIKGVLFIISDYTLIRKKDEELSNKSAIIKEIHHRVKNNLQMIASLLRLQIRRIKSRAVEKAFQESINRIESIALVHEELSKVGLDKINLKTNIASIMNMILTSMIPSYKDIQGIVEGEDVYVDAKVASSLFLCITELIQNSVEHAFPFRKKGRIKVKICKEQNEITIMVEDDGIGFNIKKRRSSLGLEIIEMITEETLKGTFNIQGHTYGTQTKITFISN